MGYITSGWDSRYRFRRAAGLAASPARPRGFLRFSASIARHTAKRERATSISRYWRRDDGLLPLS
jgi:hypothetical protein